MKAIEIDFDVWKELTRRLNSEHDTYNDVLRRIFKLKGEKPSKANERVPPNWVCRGGSIPIGTELMARYKGKVYEAEVTEHGIKYEDEHYRTPSEAAMAITKVNVNGWMFWAARGSADSEWRSLSATRPEPKIIQAEGTGNHGEY